MPIPSHKIRKILDSVGFEDAPAYAIKCKFDNVDYVSESDHVVIVKTRSELHSTICNEEFHDSEDLIIYPIEVNEKKVIHKHRYSWKELYSLYLSEELEKYNKK